MSFFLLTIFFFLISHWAFFQGQIRCIEILTKKKYFLVSQNIKNNSEICSLIFSFLFSAVSSCLVFFLLSFWEPKVSMLTNLLTLLPPRSIAELNLIYLVFLRIGVLLNFSKAAQSHFVHAMFDLPQNAKMDAFTNQSVCLVSSWRAVAPH